MGASKEKKRRLEEKNAGIESKWEERAKEEQAKKKESKKYYAIAAAFLVVSIVILFFSSNFFYSAFDAVKVATTGYSAPEYKFFYNDTYYSYYEYFYAYYGEYASYFMPDEATLQEATFDTIAQITMMYDKAKAEGFEMPEEGKESIEQSIEAVKTAATTNGFPNVDGFLSAQFGKGMNLKAYRNLVEKRILVSHYYNEKYNEFKYSDAEIEKYYEDNKDDLDVFTFYAKFFSGAEVADDEKTEENEAMTAEEAMAKAKSDADAYFAAEGAYEKLKTEVTASTTAGASISSDYAEWVTAAERVEGDLTKIEVENGYYVVGFEKRDNNEYNMVNIRHVLITPEELTQDGTIPEDVFKDLQETNDTKAKEKADLLYQQWLNAGATEAGFIEMAKENSADGNAADGGIYENVYKGQMVKEFEEWCYAPHEAGDSGIVKTQFGYHIMYYIGEGDSYRVNNAEAAMREADYNAWLEDALEGYEVTTTSMFKFAD